MVTQSRRIVPHLWFDYQAREAAAFYSSVFPDSSMTHISGIRDTPFGKDKRGSIAANLPPILQRLNMDPEQWLKAASGIEKRFYSAIGPVATLEQYCQRLKKRWLHGAQNCKALYLQTRSVAFLTFLALPSELPTDLAD